MSTETPNQKKLRKRREKLAAHDAKCEKMCADRRKKGFDSTKRVTKRNK